MMILKDRITSNNYEIKISDGQLFLYPTVAAESGDPIFKDFNLDKYWQLFVSDGTIGIEETLTELNQVVHLWDVTTLEHYILIVDDGNFGIYLFSGALVKFCRIYSEPFINCKVYTKPFIDILLHTGI